MIATLPSSALETALADVLAQPAEDAPRLAYAAELRRLGREAEAGSIERDVAQARRFDELGAGAPERIALRHAGPQAFPSHKTPRVTGWGASEGLGGAWEVHSRRGFVEAAVVEAVTGEDLARAGARHPIVSLSIRGPSSEQPARAPRALLGSPWMARLRHLALHEFKRADDVAGALGAARLSGLERLTLSFCEIDNAAAQALSASDLPALEHLVLRGHSFRASGLLSLLERFGSSLRTLCIEDHAGINDGWIQALAKVPLPNLRFLALGGREKGFAFSDAAVVSLCEATHLARVRISLVGGKSSAIAQRLLDARFPPVVLADVGAATGDGLVVSCSVTNSWSIDRELAPPSIELSQGYSLRTIVGAMGVLVDGALRNDFDPLTLAPGETRRIGLRIPPDAVPRVPPGRAQLQLGGASAWIELSGP